MLKRVRVVLALLVFVLLTFFFLDFADLLPQRFHVLAHIQFVPALINAAGLGAAILAALVVLTLLFGRIYCSVICPSGVFQDAAGRAGNMFRKKKKRFKYSRPRTILRWSIVVVIAVAFAAGSIAALGLLDPYSIWGRIAANLFKPIYLAGNNLLAKIFNSQGNYTFYHVDVVVTSVSALLVALASFLAIGYMGARHGRTYCNTVCPVGTVLGLLSRCSLLRIRIDAGRCTGCGVCAAKCKSMCIDAKAKTVDHSRCVTCYNCLGSCKFEALSYSGPGKAVKQAQSEAEAGPAIAAGASPNDTAPADRSRRRFLAASLMAAAMAPRAWAQSAAGKLAAPLSGRSVVSYKQEFPIAPPGAGSFERLLGKCTSCHLCVSKCPSHIIRPALGEYGLKGFMMPTVGFRQGFCNYDCTICGDVCPNGALQPLTVDEKHVTQVGRVTLLEQNCVVHTEGTNCGACAEHCPTQAVTMVPLRDGLTQPKVDPEICVGCGGCEFICPVRPFRAIYVNGNPVHLTRKAFEDTEKVVIDDDFGFGF